MSNNKKKNLYPVADNLAIKISRRLIKIFLWMIILGVVFWWGLGAGIINPAAGILIWIAGFGLIIFRKRIYRQITKYIRRNKGV